MHLPYEPTEVIVPNAELKSNNEADFYKQKNSLPFNWAPHPEKGVLLFLINGLSSFLVIEESHDLNKKWETEPTQVTAAWFVGANNTDMKDISCKVWQTFKLSFSS